MKSSNLFKTFFDSFRSESEYPTCTSTSVNISPLKELIQINRIQPVNLHCEKSCLCRLLRCCHTNYLQSNLPIWCRLYKNGFSEKVQCTISNDTRVRDTHTHRWTMISYLMIHQVGNTNTDLTLTIPYCIILCLLRPHRAEILSDAFI